MFKKGEVVMNRLFVSVVSDIRIENNKEYYVLKSLEEDNCTYKVPIKNEFDTIAKLPSEQYLQGIFENLVDEDVLDVDRTIIDKSCKPILDSLELSQWLRLLKTLYIDRIDIQEAGKKVPQKAKNCYETIFDRFTSILSYVYKKEPADIRLYMEDILSQNYKII